MNEAEFDEFVLANMPYFIAFNYQRLLETQESLEQAKLIAHIFSLGLRALTINLVLQYLVRDRDKVNDSYLEYLLRKKFPELTWDTWLDMFFTVLRAYEERRDLFFIPELYDFYWDTSSKYRRKRIEIEHIFGRLNQAAAEIQMGEPLPQDEREWKVWVDELIGLLHQALRSLSFIENYDLIRVSVVEDSFYDFELFKGIHISVGRRPLPRLTKLIPGWFFLRTAEERFLPLYPLMIFWEEKIVNGNNVVPADTGVFDRVVYEHLRYLLITPGEFRVDYEHISDFITIIRRAIGEGSRAYKIIEKLTWAQLCDISRDITERRMTTVKQKYQEDLYLQRNKTLQKFEAFLASEKRFFVLIGRSGVGKSNFFLSLNEEIDRLRSDVCILMYDGANLPVTSSVTEVISEDFRDRLVLSERPIEQIWHEIAKIDGIENRTVLLCIDAINENAQATELLRQLDTLGQKPWPWLKILFSSRPETWQGIRRGIKLAEALYFREEGTEILEIVLEPFSYSEKIEPFSRQELSNAYAKYKRKFELQTSYEELSNNLREVLRDPFNLLLIAKTYQGGSLPDKVRASELIEQYIKALIMYNLLRLDDLQFLEKRLLPLMVREGHYNNIITAAELEAPGKNIYEMVYSDQILSNGQKVNQAFLNLSDADILMRQEQELNQKIAFKYERFYDYFVGKRIASLSAVQADRYTFFLNLIEEVARTPFLWGAVRNALVQEAKEHGSETILKLSRTTQQRVKEMMISVLITLGLDADAVKQVEGILANLLPQEKKATEWRKGQQLLGKKTEVFPIASRNAGRIATEVASHLNLPRILQMAALQGDSTIRTAAVRSTYYLWQRHPEEGFEVLEALAENATRGLIPNMTAFESALVLSLLIFFEHVQDKFVIERLQSIWHKIIAKLLHIEEKRSSWGSFVREFIRERLFSFTTTIMFRLLREFPDYMSINEQGLEAFFQLGTAEKALYRSLIQYLDIDGNYSHAQMESDFFQAIKINNLFIFIVTFMVLVTHARHDPLTFLPFLKMLFEEAKSDIASYSYLGDITNTTQAVLELDPMIDEYFEFFVYSIEVCHDYYSKYPQALRSRFARAPEVADLGPYLFTQYRRAGTIRTPWFETRIQTALSQKKAAFFDILITTEFHLLSELQKPQIALEVLEMFFNSGNEEIDQMVLSFLTWLRVHYPDEVDDFLEHQNAPSDFRLQVQTNEPVETVGELIGIKAWSFMRDDVMSSPYLLGQLMRIFEKAADCKNLRAWLDYFIRELVNMIYGGEALRQSE